jgi:hypothetical protein
MSTNPKGCLQHVSSDLSLRQFSRTERLALLTIIVCGLGVRAALQHGRVFTGDEVGTLNYLKRSPAYILTHFSGHLTMNYFILAEKFIASLCGAADWRLTLLPLAGAVAVIPLTAAVALKFTGSTRTALIAASLAAFNPYLIGYGPEIRSYSLLVTFSLLAINEFLHWYQKRDWWSGARCAGAVLLLLLAHLNGIYTVVFLILLLASETLSLGFAEGRKFFCDSRTLWVPLAGAAVLLAVAYSRLLPDIAKFNKDWSDTPPTSLGYLPELFIWHTSSSGYFAFLIALLLLAGVWSATQEKRSLLLLCAAVILPPVLMSLQGMSHYSHAYARFLISSVPLLLILVAEGIDWLTRHVPMRRGVALPAWCLTAVIVLCWTPHIYEQILGNRRWPYASAAKFLQAEMQKQDVIVAEWGMGFNMSQFFEHSEDRIMMPARYINKVADQPDAATPGRVFYVTPSGVLKGRKTPVKRFARIEVTIYDGETARTLLQKWREDLRTRTAGKIAPGLQDDYEVLALIEEGLHSDQSAEHWQLLAARCREQTEVARHVPRQRLKAVRPDIFR